MRLIDWMFAAESLDGCGAVDSYLHRWRLLALPNGRRLYLHHFVGDDWSRDLHDHPKAFVSIGLCGWYIEETPGPKFRAYIAPWFRRFPPEHVHRLVVPSSCWTLVYTGPTMRPWGFWRGKMWVPWRRYVEKYGGGDC